MRSRRRNVLIVTAVVVLVAAGIGLAVYLRKRAAPEPARLLPNSDAVLYFNLKAVRRVTDFGSKQIPHREPEYEEFVRQTGFQFERDLNEAAFAVHTIVRPPAIRGGPPITEHRYSEVFVGKFDGQRLSAYLRKLSKSVDRYRETDIFNIPVEDRIVRVAILDVDSVAASNVDDPSVIRGIINRSRSAALPFSGPPLVSEYYRNVPIGSVLWAMARIPASATGARPGQGLVLPGGFDILLPSDSTVVAWVRYLGYIRVHAEFYTQTPVDAKQFADQTSALLTLFKSLELGSQTGTMDQDLRAALESLKVEQDGARASVTASIPSNFLKKILEEPPVDVTGTDQPPPPKTPEPKRSKKARPQKKR